MDREEEKVASLLGALDRVGPPAGFESLVMRRIAESSGGPAASRPVFMLVLKFAAPAAMLLLMGMLFVFFGDREVSIGSVPPVRDGELAPAKLEQPSPANGSIASAISAPVRTPVANVARDGSNAAPSGGSSEDIAVSGPGETLRPPGIDPNPRNVDPSDVTRSGGVKLPEVLSVLGISSTCAADGCRVNSVSQASVAGGKLGAGDRIVAIDGRPVNDATTFSGRTSFGSFQVVRDGRTMTVSLGPN